MITLALGLVDGSLVGSEVESGFKSVFKEDFKKYTFSEPMCDNLFNFADCGSFPFGSHFSIQLLAISDRLGEFARFVY